MSDYEDDDYDDPLKKDIKEDDYMPNRLIPVNKKRIISWRNKSSKPSNILNDEPSLKKTKIENKSNFFTQTIIELYLSNVSSHLTNKTIMNLDQFLNYFRNNTRTDYNISTRLRVGLVRENICSNIEIKYLDQIFERTIEQPGNYIDYDIVFIVDTSFPKNDEQIEKSIISFAVVQRNECNKFANAYALNLICSRKCFSCGNILIGLYLFTILCHPKKTDRSLRLETINPPININDEYFGQPILHMGLLEISGGYKNITGLCLYSKFGFRINTKLSGNISNCFLNDNNISMIKRFNSDDSTNNDDTLENIIRDEFDIENEKNKIIQIVNKENPGYKKHIICEFKDKEVQDILGKLYNELKDTQKTYSKLLIQSKWPINKIDNELTPEFKLTFEPVESKIKSIQEKINKIELSPREITIAELDLLIGGKKYRKYMKKNKSKKNKSKKNKTKKNKTKKNKTKKIIY
jgi:hypothetical protein